MNEIDTPTPGHYRTYCASCGADIGPAPADCWWDTHGICEECDAKLRERSNLPADFRRSFTWGDYAHDRSQDDRGDCQSSTFIITQLM